MKIIKTKLEGVVIIEPQVFFDDRGYFFESFSQQRFNEQVAPITFVQDNESKSSYGVLRGLHFQKPPFAQSKLVRVVKGKVLGQMNKLADVFVCGHDVEHLVAHIFRVRGHKMFPAAAGIFFDSWVFLYIMKCSLIKNFFVSSHVVSYNLLAHEN